MDALDRLYRRISLTMARDPGRTLTIGDLYQEIVPYRAIRTELGFAELAQYEHVLLRLLAGEREYLELEGEEAAEEFRRELQAPNPILGIYRDYAEVGVHPNPFAPLPQPDPTAPPRVVTPPPAAGPGVAAPDLPPPPPEVPAPPRPRPCPGCRAPLPREREARFCPFCGKCLVPVPCGDCSAMIEPEWSYCASCGAARGGPAPHPERRLR